MLNIPFVEVETSYVDATSVVENTGFESAGLRDEILGIRQNDYLVTTICRISTLEYGHLEGHCFPLHKKMKKPSYRGLLIKT